MDDLLSKVRKISNNEGSGRLETLRYMVRLSRKVTKVKRLSLGLWMFLIGIFVGDLAAGEMWIAWCFMGLGVVFLAMMGYTLIMEGHLKELQRGVKTRGQRC